MSRSKMEAELKCFQCTEWFKNPLLLPCAHSVCKKCADYCLISPEEAVHVQQHAKLQNELNQHQTSTATFSVISDHESVDDRLSVFSEADSGVVVSSNNKSTSGGSSNAGGTINPQTNPSSISATNLPAKYAILCKICNRINLLDEQGTDCLLNNRALEHVVERFIANQSSTSSPSKSSNGAQSEDNSLSEPLCHLCEDDKSPQFASIVCQQCQIFYCSQCISRCHPARGPFVKHILFEKGTPGWVTMAKKNQSSSSEDCHADGETSTRSSAALKCRVHHNQELTVYCASCRAVICCSCLQEAHLQHDLHQLNTVCKAQKTELSQLLQSLSERAKSGTYFIQNLKSMSEKINKNYPKREEEIISTMDTLIRSLEQKKQELLSQLKSEKERKTIKIKDHIHLSTSALGKANGLLQFCIEMLKESDPTAFLLVSHSLISKVSSAEQTFLQDLELKPKLNTEFDIRISNMEIIRSAITSLRLSENNSSNSNTISSSANSGSGHISHNPLHQISSLTSTSGAYSSGSIGAVSLEAEAPHAPIIWREQCRVESNIITVIWQPYPGPPVEYYTLEIDDGANGSFRKVYRGCESICTVEGLHFRSMYRIRVKSHNRHGDSKYSDVVCLQTAFKTWFYLDCKQSKSTDVVFTNDNTTISTDSLEDRTILASTSLSRGVHYWEFVVDKLEPGAQPSFGIAKVDCNKEQMLGKDALGWSMYIDSKRSWFIHNNDHFERTDGGIKVGSIIGVRIDCDKGNLSYYINDEPHGPIAFSKTIKGTVYPAVSINKFVQLTLVIGRTEIPSESSSSDESGEEEK